MRPWILAVVGCTVAVLIAVVVFAFTGLGATIKAVVESVGSEATGTEVTLRAADVSLASGEGRLTGLVVGNPKGYATKSAFELGDIRVKLDTSTVTSDVVVIDEIVIDGPHVTFEIGPGGSNLNEIQAHVLDGSPKAVREDANSGGRRFIIRKLRVTNGRIDGATTLVSGEKLSARLGDFSMENVGKDKGGATATRIGRSILIALVQSSLDAVQKQGLDSLKDRAGKKIGDALKGVLGK